MRLGWGEVLDPDEGMKKLPGTWQRCQTCMLYVLEGPSGGRQEWK